MNEEEEVQKLAESLKASGLATEKEAMDKARQMLTRKNKGQKIGY